MDVYDLLTLAMSCKNVFYRPFSHSVSHGTGATLSVGAPENFLSYFPIHREMFTGHTEWDVTRAPPAFRFCVKKRKNIIEPQCTPPLGSRLWVPR